MKVNEIFGGSNVVQGEGPFAGQPATFIRLWGCVPPYCKFCDTKYSWSNEKEECQEMNIMDIVKRVERFGLDKLVVITGGEPFAQVDIYTLCRVLRQHGFKVQIETSGKALIDNGNLNLSCVTIVMSPKQYDGKFIVESHFYRDSADFYKFVVETDEEMKTIIKFIKRFGIDPTTVYLMGKGETREKQLKLMPKIFEWCNKYKLKYSPRLHVLAFNVKRGV